jgi:hypothetical protein
VLEEEMDEDMIEEVTLDEDVIADVNELVTILVVAEVT